MNRGVRILSAAAALAVALTPTIASAKCGTGNPAAYDDVEAIMFTQNGCRGTIQDADTATLKSPQFPRGWFASSFDCSTFWVFFWETGPTVFPTTYSQFNLKDSVGTFHISATLGEARALLKSADFFALSPRSMSITDTASSVLSVKRCSVVTKISLYNTSSVDEDAQTVHLFEELRALVMHAKATRTSTEPTNFGETGLFDP